MSQILDRGPLLEFSCSKQHTGRDGENYAGPYKYDSTTGKVTGNPARATSVRRLIKMINAKDGAKGAAAARHHAEAIRIEELAKLMEWSEKRYSFEALGRKPENTDELLLAVKHGMMRGFMSTGFTLWTR